MAQPFLDRADAGRRLASMLRHYKDKPGVVILALPRGGVPVAYEVARELRLPLDVFLVRKLGVPGQRELAMGAIASGGVRVLNEDVIAVSHIPPEVIEAVAATEQAELDRREREYRDGRLPRDVQGVTAILVDDGLATGSSMRAAIRALRAQDAGKIVVAVPVGAARTCRELAREADELVCAEIPEQFYAVGEWYLNFWQTSDGEVRELLARAAGSPVGQR